MLCFWFLLTTLSMSQPAIVVLPTSPQDAAFGRLLLSDLAEASSELHDRVQLQESIHDVAKLQARLETLEHDANVGLIVVLGATGAQLIERGVVTEKPVLTTLSGDASLFGVADVGTNANVGALMDEGRIARDLTAFAALNPLKTVKVLVDASLDVSDSYLANLSRGLGMDLQLVKVFSGATTVALDTGDVAYVAALPFHEESQRKALFTTIAKQGVTVVSERGLADVNLGAFAGLVVAGDASKARRLIDHLIALDAGTSVDLLSDFVPLQEQLTINGQVAAKLGVAVDLKVRMQADVVHPPQGAETLNLAQAVAEAIRNNPDLRAEEAAAEVADRERRMAASQLLPQVSARTDWTQTNNDSTQVAAGISPETQSILSLQARQILFDDATITDTRIARLRRDIADDALKVQYLNVVSETAGGWLNLLAANALLDIEIKQLKRVRANLRTARARFELGSGGREEVLRWESEEAQQISSVYVAKADVDAAVAEIARLLGREGEVNWSSTMELLTAEDTLFLSPEWETLVSQSGPALELFLMGYAREHAPDVAVFDHSTEIAVLQKGAATRTFFVPKLEVNASLSDTLDRDFAVSPMETPIGQGAEENWSVTVSASIPVFLGGRRIHELGRARAEVRQAELERISAEQSIGASVRRSLAAVRGSQPRIALSELARDRAEQNMAIVGDRYRQGGASILDVLEAQEQALAQQRQAALTRYEHLANVLNLQRALAHFDFLLDEPSRKTWFETVQAAIEGGGIQ